MKLLKIAGLGVVGAAALAAGVAVANHHGSGHHGKRGAGLERMFDRADANRDNILTQDEVLNAAALRFASIDTNNDGQISRDERRASRRAHMDERFQRADTDGSGTLTLAEMQAVGGERAQRRFARLDTTGDGQIDRTELENRPHKRGGDRARHGGKRAATLNDVQERALKIFARADANSDGVVTRDEAAAARGKAKLR